MSKRQFSVVYSFDELGPFIDYGAIVVGKLSKSGTSLMPT